MARPSKFTSQKKQQIVVAVMRGELSIAEAARRFAASEGSIAKWRDLFVDGTRRGPSGREARLEQEVSDLTHALGEAHVELRALRRGGASDFAARSLR
ncbi:MAG TPA: helix-turn-helix domain-containing protein [Solirubrobacteraceae bacterium]|jgi:transposase|nr:helix-turn-helix domain-containing protein [Solirubrobacteraceae bacterium]